MKSLWRAQEEKLEAGPADLTLKKVHWDVIVIGAGMAGILIAYQLKEQGRRVLVLEADTIASGQTERTTAKITSQHGCKYSSLIKKVGKEKARLYAQANEAAIKEYERLIKKYKIDCQFERVTAYLYSRKEEEKLRNEIRAAKEVGIDAFFTKETQLPFPVVGAAGFRHQAQFSPLIFLQYIAAQLEVLEHTKVIGIKDHQVMTNASVFSADKIVVAAHYPFLNIPGFYFLRQHQERSYVLALAGCERIQGMYYGIDEDGLSFRQAGEHLLLGGSGHRTGIHHEKCAYENLWQKARKYYPECREAYRWSAQDCMPHDGIPFIGRYSYFTPDLYVATGFQKWGMTSSMVAAMILRDEICEREHPYGKVFSPQRMNVRASIGNLLCDVGMSIEGLIKGIVPQGPGRCAHLGCGLTWNPDENSWDCPCHGSRYDDNGRLLDNPSKRNLKNMKVDKKEEL